MRVKNPLKRTEIVLGPALSERWTLGRQADEETGRMGEMEPSFRCMFTQQHSLTLQTTREEEEL